MSGVYGFYGRMHKEKLQLRGHSTWDDFIPKTHCHTLHEHAAIRRLGDVMFRNAYLLDEDERMGYLS